MSETSHHDPSSVAHYDLPEDRLKHRSASHGLGTLSLIFLVAAGVLASMLLRQRTIATDTKAQLDRTSAELVSTKSDLGNANAKSTDLQMRLDKAQQQQSELQVAVKKSEEFGTGLQTQLEQSRADLRSQQEKMQTQISDLQAQFSQAKDVAEGLRKDLATAKSQADDLQAQLAAAKENSAKLAPAVAQARALPLTTEFKQSLFGGTLTLDIKNAGIDHLKLDIQITGSDKTPSRAATLEGGGELKIVGLAAGAKVVIASDGFDSLTLMAK